MERTVPDEEAAISSAEEGTATSNAVADRPAVDAAAEDYAPHEIRVAHPGSRASRAVCGRCIVGDVGGVRYHGVVVALHLDIVSREKLVLIRYDDGEFEHLTLEQFVASEVPAARSG